MKNKKFSYQELHLRDNFSQIMFPMRGHPDHNSILYKQLTLNLDWMIQEFTILEEEKRWYGRNAKFFTKRSILVQIFL